MITTMIKHIITSVIIIFTLSANAQTLVKGKIIDAKTRQPIPFSTVALKSTQIGTVANIDGCYQLNCTKKLSNADTLIFSSLGYHDKIIVGDRFNAIISLQKKAYTIPEIVVYNKKPTVVELGVKRSAKKKGGVGTQSKMNFQEVLYIPNDLQIEGWIKTISYYILKDGVPNTPFRVRIFAKNDTLECPDKDILNKSVIVSGKKRGGWVTVEIDSLHIPFPKNGAFIGMEWLYDKNNYHYSKTYSIKGKKVTSNRFGQIIGTTYSISEFRTWWCLSSYDKWRPFNFASYKKKKPENIMVKTKIKYYK